MSSKAVAVVRASMSLAFALAGGLAVGIVPVVAAPARAVPPLTVVVPEQQIATVSRSMEARIHLDLASRHISVMRNGQRLGRWPVAIGDPKTPTPSGLFRVENMRVNPQYQSTKSGEVNPVTGPKGPLGHRWIGFLQRGDDQFGIHGTPWPHWVKIRAAVSNGCVRMLNDHVQRLYELVDVGTPVLITR